MRGRKIFSSCGEEITEVTKYDRSNKLVGMIASGEGFVESWLCALDELRVAAVEEINRGMKA